MSPSSDPRDDEPEIEYADCAHCDGIIFRIAGGAWDHEDPDDDDGHPATPSFEQRLPFALHPSARRMGGGWDPFDSDEDAEAARNIFYDRSTTVNVREEYL